MATPSEDLVEWDYGAYEGHTTAEIRKNVLGWSIWSGAVPGGEIAKQVGERAKRVIQQALAIDGDVAVFAHGHLLRVLAAVWLGLEPQAGRLFASTTGSLSILGYERETRVMRVWNQDWRLIPDEAASREEKQP